MSFFKDILGGIGSIFGFENGTMAVPRGRVLDGVPVRVAVRPKRAKKAGGAKRKRKAKK